MTVTLTPISALRHLVTWFYLRSLPAGVDRQSTEVAVPCSPALSSCPTLSLRPALPSGPALSPGPAPLWITPFLPDLLVHWILIRPRYNHRRYVCDEVILSGREQRREALGMQ